MTEAQLLHPGGGDMMIKCMVFIFVSILFTGCDLFSQDSLTKDPQIVGTKFPTISAETLAGTRLTLPDAAEGNITLIVIAFKREAQAQLDSWLRPYLQEFGTKPGFTFYEIPMLALYWKLMSWMIDSGMRSGIEVKKHNNVMTYYGNINKYRRALDLDHLTRGYVFLLDPEGVIRWQGQGYSTKDALQEIRDCVNEITAQKVALKQLDPL
jgi:hypothetical protein